ncbi:MAG: bifunctional oligoribonuclease/PAP phosphatase NrnA [Syntrophomonas sp.]|uniref:DHH family phosphoesterase n=1 Tax=Syntrophomonas sp. TaxID=2053627 RepID=UPI00262A2FE2|nr:bifunctional oligoribonuclease/PAP phosphatase NrnA [Syntrophomonas sp.]MDD2510016.1 bifunctional oligoribonuclease/PAP phosphatase NrnA [Syntrophomonas sp.]MDD3879438.1 bifunctional oligoribonuclease/PAP phosphatase NrnA [Syntrophomonas sp.]MDD4626107.1 bifunctional oligoribonuclease/PAP phosphatase NrnA [Syntrophomonas sp.]
MNDLKEIARKIKDSDDFLLVGHKAPDGDCIGSLLGLYLGLEAMGKRVGILLSDPVPPIYHYLTAVEQVKQPGEIQSQPPNLIFLDCSDEQRVGQETFALIQHRNCSINIDHHQSNNFFGDFNYIDASAAATAEIITELLLHMQVNINAAMADALLAGIIMDTGSFLNANTTGKTLRIAAELLNFGASVNLARINLFESKSRKELLMLQRALQHLDFTADGRIAWMSLPYQEMADIGAEDLYPEGLINYTRMIEGVEVGILFREMPAGKIKVGFRSRGQVDVAALAQKFGGGGHRQASGAQCEGKLEEVKSTVILAVKDVI